MPAPSPAADLVLPAPSLTTLPVQGTTARFAVHRLYCVGRNYADHAIEMGHDPTREAPFFFLKSPDCLLSDGADFPYPPVSQDVHHEVELVVALKSGGRDITVEQALEHVYGYAVGLDMTRRDLQAALKKAGRPWEAGKGFDHSAPCGAIAPAAQIGHPASAAIRLMVNGTERQAGTLDQMIWNVPEIISELSKLFTLQAGDLIMTGTPAGVGPVARGDRMEARIEGVGDLSLKVI